jgi:hypothetical protein
MRTDITPLIDGLDRHAANCKFCGAHLILQFDPECPIKFLDGWKKAAACNRCADFKTVMINHRDRLQKVVVRYITLRNSGHEIKPETLAEIRAKIVSITKAIADDVCRFYGTTTTWEPDWPDMIIDVPTKSQITVSHYIGQIRSIASRAS